MSKGGGNMKAHKNFGIAAAIFMVITIFTGINEESRKTHGVWACLTVFCMIGAIITGKKMVGPKKVEEELISSEKKA